MEIVYFHFSKVIITTLHLEWQNIKKTRLHDMKIVLGIISD